MQQSKPWERDWSQPQSAPPQQVQQAPIASPSAVPQRIYGAPKQPDPLDLRRLQLAEEAASRAQAKEQRDADIDVLQAQKLQGDIAESEQKRAKESGKKTPEQLSGAQDELIRVVNAAQRAKRLSQEGWFATGFGADTAAKFSGTSAADIRGLINTIGANTAFARLQKMREESPTGGALGAVTEKELAFLRDTIASIDPTQSDAQFQANMDQVIQAYADTYRRLGGDDERLRVALGELPESAKRETEAPEAAVPGATPPAPGSPPPSPDGSPPITIPGVRERLEISTAPQQAYATESDKRFAAALQAILDRGGSVDEANRLAGEFGSYIDPAQWDEAVRYNKSRPKGAPKAGVVTPETGVRELSRAQQVIGDISSSGFGAAITGAANAATAGFADELYGGVQSLVTGKPIADAIAEMDFRKGLIRQQSPNAFLAGEVAGGVGTQLGLARAIPALRSGGTFAPGALAADVGYGAAYGAGEQNLDRLGGSVSGGLTSAAGGVAGRAIGKGLAGAIAPDVDPNVALLRDKGVQLTPGQAIGPTASRIEEKLTSIPLVGDLIRSGRTKALESFNTAVANDALSAIGKKLPEGSVGTAAMRFGQKAFDDAYEQARSGMKLRGDAQMVAELQALQNNVAQGALDDAAAKRLQKIYDAQIGRRLKGGGRVSGDEYKKMVSALGKLQVGARKTNMELADAIGDLKGIVDRAARRSSPADAVAKMDAADKGYALWARIENAAARRGGDTGAFTPSQLDAAVQQGDVSTRSKAYLRGEARGQKLAEAGKQILRDEVPNSGTVDRSLMAGGAGLLAYLEPTTLAGAGGLGAVYAPGVRDFVSKIATRDSSQRAKNIADAIRKRKRAIGAAGSPLALTYSPRE